MYRVLVAEDDPTLLRHLVKALEKGGFKALPAENGAVAMQIHRIDPVDLMILDLLMPVMDGFQVLAALRPGDTVPVLMLTSMGQEQTRLAGFGLGADDYMVKPFSIPELLARIGAILRRTPLQRRPKLVRTGPFELNLFSNTLTRDGQPIELSPTEHLILKALVTYAGRFLSRAEMVDAVWPKDSRPAVQRTVDMHVMHLRKKLLREGDPPWIASTSRQGYSWICPVEKQDS